MVMGAILVATLAVLYMSTGRDPTFSWEKDNVLYPVGLRTKMSGERYFVSRSTAQSIQNSPSFRRSLEIEIEKNVIVRRFEGCKKEAQILNVEHLFEGLELDPSLDVDKTPTELPDPVLSAISATAEKYGTNSVCDKLLDHLWFISSKISSASSSVSASSPQRTKPIRPANIVSSAA